METRTKINLNKNQNCEGCVLSNKFYISRTIFNGEIVCVDYYQENYVCHVSEQEHQRQKENFNKLKDKTDE